MKSGPGRTQQVQGGELKSKGGGSSSRAENPLFLFCQLILFIVHLGLYKAVLSLAPSRHKESTVVPPGATGQRRLGQNLELRKTSVCEPRSQPACRPASPSDSHITRPPSARAPPRACTPHTPTHQACSPACPRGAVDTIASRPWGCSSISVAWPCHSQWPDILGPPTAILCTSCLFPV